MYEESLLLDLNIFKQSFKKQNTNTTKNVIKVLGENKNPSTFLQVKRCRAPPLIDSKNFELIGGFYVI